MKKNLFLHIMLMVLLVSCHETYPGLDFDLSGDDIKNEEFVIDSVIVDKDRLPITLAIVDPSFTTLSRSSVPTGSGAFDSERPDTMRIPHLKNADFHILGIQNTEEADYTVTREQDSCVCIVDNATAHVSDMNSLLLTFNNTEENEPINYYYSHDHMLNKFNFYAYYIDNLEKPTLNREKDCIWFNFQVDGSQDVLTGNAKLTQKQQAKINAHEEKDSLQNYYYSTYTATRDIIPVIDLDHAMARLKFFIYPGDETANNLVVKSIRIYAQYKGKLTVAHRDASLIGATWSSEKQWLDLRDEGDEPTLNQNNYRIQFLETEKNEYIYDRTSMQVGESLLVPPAYTYKVEVKVAELNEENKPIATYLTSYDLENKDLFKASYEYQVRIALFGPDEITIDAILTGWATGGEVITDMDDNFIL